MVHSIKNTTVQKHAENIEWLYPIFQDIENKETEKNAEMERFYIFFALRWIPLVKIIYDKWRRLWFLNSLICFDIIIIDS